MHPKFHVFRLKPTVSGPLAMHSSAEAPPAPLELDGWLSYGVNSIPSREGKGMNMKSSVGFCYMTSLTQQCSKTSTHNTLTSPDLIPEEAPGELSLLKVAHRGVLSHPCTHIHQTQFPSSPGSLRTGLHAPALSSTPKVTAP